MCWFQFHWKLFPRVQLTLSQSAITHWGQVTYICISSVTIIRSDNDLSPGRRQAIIWTNAGILLIGPLGTKFSEILIGIYAFSFKKMHLKMSSRKWRPFCLCLNVIITQFTDAYMLHWFQWVNAIMNHTDISVFERYQQFFHSVSNIRNSVGENEPILFIFFHS